MRRARDFTHQTVQKGGACKHTPYMKRPMSNARISGMVATVALLLMAGLVVWVVWL